jgi:hypothetical protein
MLDLSIPVMYIAVLIIYCDRYTSSQHYLLIIAVTTPDT